MQIFIFTIQNKLRKGIAATVAGEGRGGGTSGGLRQDHVASLQPQHLSGKLPLALALVNC